jgi:hypothetical protein
MLTVGELIEQLKGFDKDMEVRFSYNTRDYTRTQVAAAIRNVENSAVSYSEYHEMDQLDEDGDKLVVVLS